MLLVIVVTRAAKSVVHTGDDLLARSVALKLVRTDLAVIL